MPPKKFTMKEAREKRDGVIHLLTLCVANGDTRAVRRAALLLWEQGMVSGQRKALADMRKPVR